jgi:hypothetical protein
VGYSDIVCKPYPHSDDDANGIAAGNERFDNCRARLVLTAQNFVQERHRSREEGQNRIPWKHYLTHSNYFLCVIDQMERATNQISTPARVTFGPYSFLAVQGYGIWLCKQLQSTSRRHRYLPELHQLRIEGGEREA